MESGQNFDIIVIGAGPAGCYAALTAAKKGVRVALFEEHNSIGWPRHDPGWLMECNFSQSLIASIDKNIPWNKVQEYRVCQAETGDTIERSELGGYLVRRDLMEKEIASQAVSAGASLFLRTRVEKLVKGNSKVTGVITSSSVIPKATAKIIICADGIRSAVNGFALSEGLCQKTDAKPGVSYLLANAEVTGGVIEHFLSPESLLNYKCFFTHRDNASYLSFPSHDAFYEIAKRNDNVISKKIKFARPVEMSGYSTAHSDNYGEYFKKIVLENVLIIGDSSGGAGNIHGMIQGKLAAMIAVDSIEENDVTESRLLEYQDLVFKKLGQTPFCWFTARERFGSFDSWFRQFKESVKDVQASELR